MLVAQSVIDAQAPAFHQREDAMNPWQSDVARHLADRAWIVAVAGEARIGAVAVSEQPGRTLARMKACREAAELSGIAASRTRPERVSRYFALNFRGLARFVVRSTTSIAPATMILPACRGSKKASSVRNGISV